MAAKRSPAAARLSRNRLIARKHVSQAFRFCLTSTHLSPDAAASLLGVTRRTIYAWLRCETALTLEIVLGCPQLAGAFRQALCTFDHSESSAPYVAKKRGAK